MVARRILFHIFQEKKEQKQQNTIAAVRATNNLNKCYKHFVTNVRANFQCDFEQNLSLYLVGWSVVYILFMKRHDSINRLFLRFRNCFILPELIILRWIAIETHTYTAFEWVTKNINRFYDYEHFLCTMHSAHCIYMYFISSPFQFASFFSWCPHILYDAITKRDLCHFKSILFNPNATRHHWIY